MVLLVLLLASVIGHTSVIAEKIALTALSSDLRSAAITVELEKNEFLIADTISFSSSNPRLLVKTWSADSTSQARFDTVSNLPRQVYSEKVVFSVQLQPTVEPAGPTTLFMHYFASSHKYPQEQQFNIVVDKNDENTPQKQTSQPLPEPDQAKQQQYQSGMPIENKVPSTFEQGYEYIHYSVEKSKQVITTAKNHLTTLFTSSSSLTLKIILSLLLGILMSLTPCIYPMIPITVGLLGASASNSWGRNFLLAGAYTIGLALTFALLGLITVLFGTQCTKLIGSPWFSVALIAFLAYCGGSMLGLYDFYIPQFLQPSSVTQRNRGSLLSACVFGAISGTFASPCMSPGLALILTAAAQLVNPIMGFLLLFAFGIGVSMPLLIIGTFSGALHVLPRAGVWMNDFKKIFGFMLIMMCFYYAQTLLPLHVTLWGAGAFSLLCGILYLLYLRTTRTLAGKIIVVIISILLMTGGLFLCYRGFTTWYASQIPLIADTSWHHNYEEAKTRALEEHKYILADFTASWCPLCVSLDKDILQHPDVKPLFNDVVAVKIDGTSSRDVQHNTLMQRFKLLGLPQLLLIDPATEKVVASWNAKLLEEPAASFYEAVRSKIKN